MVASVLRFALLLLLLFLASVDVEGFVPTTKRSSPNWQISSIGGARESLLKARLDQTNEDDQDDEGEAGGIDRRRALTATGLAIASLWLGDTFGTDNVASKWAASAAEEASAAAASASGSRTVLITGCNSGIGLQGARILARKGGGEKIILACRTKQKAEDTAKAILVESPNANLVPAECDLASLESIKQFASTVTGDVDVVCYNAGLALNTAGDIERTADGFEKTIGTNHLGHFYLHHLLEPKIVATGKVVITASSVHDPESPGGKQGVPASLGSLEGFSRDGANFEMVDGQPYNGDKAYKDSKLCNILFCRELTRRLADKNIVVNAFSPGLITSSGFFRYQNPIFASVFNVAVSSIFKVGETPEYGGAALAYMTMVDSTKGEFYDSPPGTSNKYASDKNDYKGAFGNEFNLAQVSKEAKDEQKGRELWKLSEKLVGISSI
jgi:protochlorophyllide reductase